MMPAKSERNFVIQTFTFWIRIFYDGIDRFVANAAYPFIAVENLSIAERLIGRSIFAGAAAMPSGTFGSLAIFVHPICLVRASARTELARPRVRICFHIDGSTATRALPGSRLEVLK